ncbi:MAG TPA: MgtC/SapB family protein [Gammaproteobacteria bacterium]|nr:MgtC/SapB family protein [Gammaproteobacteria bacterium]
MESLLDAVIGPLPDAAQVARVVVRLVAALLAGAVIGLQRQRAGKAAGLRTHILVCMGTALFVLAGTEAALGPDGLSRIVQGVVTGIGFLGAGAIIKMEGTREIRGLTTAAGIWLTCAVGVVIGFGRMVIAVVALLLAWIVLAMLVKAERRIDGSGDSA